ncbi:MAG: dihydroorotate dehydrogenase electron transfer subunit, partial [Candidatus Omnitrophica bacterium]|nr:dihydroorotate dehydrogenase electron transfer subunit [Candidatus Omnitrophota bacterium]
THQQKYKIIANKKVSKRFFQLSLNAKPLLKKALPGQFVHLKISDGLKPFLRRPFSIFRIKNTLDILYDVVGDGTAVLSQKTKGDVLDCLGPLGTPFALPPRNIKQVVMIAGGVGVAPFLALTDVLKKKKYSLILLYGGRTKEYCFPMKEFEKNGCSVHVATDDGSVGKKGRVVVLFPEINFSKPTYLYVCGPKPMIACAQNFARENRLKGQASLEEVMACGMGTCLGCSIKTKKGYKTVCNDGPVFDLDEIIF